ncbi:MAG: DNA polymerase I, partial [Pseudomonadota bacterium]
QGLFALDTETTSLDYLESRVVGISIATEPGTAAYIPLMHHVPEELAAVDLEEQSKTPLQQLDKAMVLAQLKPLLASNTCLKIGHNLKYDAHVLANEGIELNGMAYDTMLESYVMNSTAIRHNLDAVSEHYLKLSSIAYESLTKTPQGTIPFESVPIPQATEYAAQDADFSFRAHAHLWPELTEGMKRVYQEIECPLMPVLLRMERVGVCLDGALLRAHSLELGEKLQGFEEQIFQMAGETFNVNSPKQLQKILYETLQLPILQKTPTGQPATSEDVLEELAALHPIANLLVQYRTIGKLKSTYTDKLPDMVATSTGRLHTHFQQAVTATGRLSSTDPNLQNIPIRDEEGRKIRQAFIAPKDYVILSADYSQIELRIMAHLSADPGLLRAFHSGGDVHRITASEIFHVPLEDVTDLQRRHAKAINFGLIYGMSPYGLAKQLESNQAVAAEYMNHYFTRYPQVKTYMDNTRELAHQQGYVETLFGRRLYLPDIRAPQVSKRRAAERAAVNAPMQGTAADLIKKAMVCIDAWTQTMPQKVRMVLQVHDELVFEVHKDAVTELAERIRQDMMQVADLSVPLNVNIAWGANWDAAH